MIHQPSQCTYFAGVKPRLVRHLHACYMHVAHAAVNNISHA